MCPDTITLEDLIIAIGGTNIELSTIEDGNIFTIAIKSVQKNKTSKMIDEPMVKCSGKLGLLIAVNELCKEIFYLNKKLIDIFKLSQVQ